MFIRRYNVSVKILSYGIKATMENAILSIQEIQIIFIASSLIYIYQSSDLRQVSEVRLLIPPILYDNA